MSFKSVIYISHVRRKYHQIPLILWHFYEIVRWAFFAVAGLVQQAGSTIKAGGRIIEVNRQLVEFEPVKTGGAQQVRRQD
jgi:hypothetical protein